METKVQYFSVIIHPTALEYYAQKVQQEFFVKVCVNTCVILNHTNSLLVNCVYMQKKIRQKVSMVSICWCVYILKFFNIISDTSHADVFPPILTFTRSVSNPWYNNGTVELSWTYNEEASSRCQLLTSVYLLVVNCSNRSVFFNNLQPGMYTLYIQAEDTVGNVAREVIVPWTVGK